MSKGILAILALLAAAGVGVSVWDYRNWRYEETKNYGHGPLESLAAPAELGVRYVNEYAGIRLRYPEGWTAVEKLKNIVRLTEAGGKVRFSPGKLTEVVEITGTKEDEVKVTVFVDKVRGDVVKILEEEVRGREAAGTKFLGEREYWHTEREDWGVLTWKEGGEMVKRAWAVGGDKTAVVEVRCRIEAADQYVRTLDEMIKALTLLN